MNGRKVAFVSATQIERSKQYTKAATETEPGVLKALHPEKFLKIVEEAAQNSDYVIAEVHWGTEGMLYPDQSQRHLAEQIAQAGADVIIGGHPHRLQALPLWVMFQLHIVLEISGFPPEHCIQHCQKLPLQRMEQ